MVSTRTERSFRWGAGVGLVVLCLLGARPAPAASATDPAGAHLPPGSEPGLVAPRPTLAAEDTIPPLVNEPYPELIINAPRLRLEEILGLVAQGEARRDSLVNDAAFTALMRLTGHSKDPAKGGEQGKGQVYWDAVSRVYKKRPDKVRTIRLKDQAYDEDGKPKADANVNVDFDADLSEQFIAFAFDPSLRSHYAYEIEERISVSDHIVYRIGFEPKSVLELLPSGRVWIDTNDFVILREEFWYRDRSPAPVFLERLDSCIIEREQIDRRYWVVSRVLARVTLADPLRWASKLAREPIPKVVDFAFQQSDWIINGGVPDSLFAPSKEKK
ncbi:MAG: hypothetical protein IT349_02705 [Candidatus Eisenbacteria bacterium]|nr:hypothetical protein [Candidatus Eisenbacteria bacterium]